GNQAATHKVVARHIEARLVPVGRAQELQQVGKKFRDKERRDRQAGKGISQPADGSQHVPTQHEDREQQQRVPLLALARFRNRLERTIEQTNYQRTAKRLEAGELDEPALHERRRKHRGGTSRRRPQRGEVLQRGIRSQIRDENQLPQAKDREGGDRRPYEDARDDRPIVKPVQG